MVDDIADGQEIAGIVHLRDQAEFVRDEVAHLVRHAIRITVGRARPGEVGQMRVRRLAAGDGFLRIFISELVEAERAGVGDAAGFGDRVRPVGEQPLHFFGAFQMPFAILGEEDAGLCDHDLFADAGHHVLQRAAGRAVVMNVVGRDELQAVPRASPRSRLIRARSSSR